VLAGKDAESETTKREMVLVILIPPGILLQRENRKPTRVIEDLETTLKILENASGMVSGL